MRPDERPTAEELAMRADPSRASRLTICPRCGRPHFYATNTYYVLDGAKKRLRKCNGCNYARTEIVPDPVPTIE